jgi:hypothetical protein
VRCIKPNQVKKPNVFVHDLTNEQLTYSGVFEAVIIMQNGYPFRLDHLEFRGFYQMIITQSYFRRLMFYLPLFNKFCEERNLFKALPGSLMEYPINEQEIKSFVAKNDPTLVSGGQKKGKPMKLDTREMTREQCIFMVKVISFISNNRVNFQKCYVGRTKVFYRAQEHLFLIEMRTEKVSWALPILQRQFRRFIAMNLVKRIVVEEKNAIHCIKTRNLERLNQSTAIMVEMASRLMRSNKLECSIKIVDICRDYTSALNKERYCEKKMTEIWDEKERMSSKLSQEEEEFYEEKIFNQLQQLMTDAKSIHFSASHKGIALSLHWEDNKTLKSFVEKIVILGQFVNLKMKYRKGLEEQNEFLLESCQKQFMVIKQSNPVNYQPKSVEDYNKKANQIIEKAKNEFDELLKTITQQLSSGKFVQRNMKATDFFAVTPTSLSIDFEVNPNPLEKLLQHYSEEFMQNPKKKRPFKVDSLLNTCENLLLLRKHAFASHWTECLDLIQTRWTNAIEHSQSSAGDINPEDLSEERMNNLLTGKEFFIPKEIYSQLINELKQLIITSIYFIVLPRLNAYILKDMVPEIPYFYESCPINTSELEKQLIDIRIYENYFDTALNEFLLIVKEHLLLRNAVVTGTKEVIASAVSSVKKVAKSHPDYVNCLKYMDLYHRSDGLIFTVINDSWKGEKGTLESSGPTQMKISPLDKMFYEIKDMTVRGTYWKYLVFLTENILTIRKLLTQGLFDNMEQIILSFLQSATWKTIYSEFENGSFQQNTDFTQLIVHIKKEIDTYLVEINHIKTLRVIISRFQKDTVPENIEIAPTKPALSKEAYKQVVSENDKPLIKNAATVQFLEESNLIIELRNYLFISNWTELTRLLLLTHAKTNNFQSCHPLCSREFQSIYTRYLDYQCRLQLAEAFAIKETPLAPNNECVLNEIIQKFHHYKNLSPKTREMMSYAKGLVALRCSVRDGFWEPDSIFPLGRVSIEELPAAIVGISDKDSSNPTTASSIAAPVSSASMTAVGATKELRSIDRTIHVFRTLDSVLSLQEIQKKIDSFDINNLSVTETFFWLQFQQRTTSGNEEKLIPVSCQEEIDDIYHVSIDRKCRILLLMASSTGKCLGTIEKLNYRSIKFDGLKGAIAYCDLNKDYWTETTRNWLKAAELLLKIRETVVDLYSGKINHPNLSPPGQPQAEILHELLNGEELQSCIDNMFPGFPIQEMKLILNKVNDLNAFEELLSALTFGAPKFENNKFDITSVQHQHLLERLEAAKRLSVRSDRLDRLFFYYELVINLRVAVSANQWDFSEKGETRKTNLDRNVVTVKKCLTEYSQAQKFFRTPVVGVPPTILTKEFSLVEREWERRLTLQRFTNAFKSGAMTGTPYQLLFSTIRTDSLEAEIARVRTMERESGEVDKGVQVFIQAAQELINIRQEALKIQGNYMPTPPQFSRPTNALSQILAEETFLPDAINLAVSRVTAMHKTKGGNKDTTTAQQQQQKSAAVVMMNREYDGLSRLINGLQYCPRLPFRLPEIDLIQIDISERQYVVEVLSYFQSMPEILAVTPGNSQIGKKPESSSSSSSSSTQLQNMIMTLIKAFSLYHQRKTQFNREDSSSNAVKKRRNLKASKVIEFINNSVIVLVHVYRAKALNVFDAFERNWKDDPNFLNTPRLLALMQQLSSGKFSFQQLIRSATKISPLHIHLNRYLTFIERELDDVVSDLEISEAITKESYLTRGEMGDLEVSEEGIDYGETVVRRINEIGFVNPVIQEKKLILEFILLLRVLTLRKKYLEIYDRIVQHLSLSDNELLTVSAVIYDPKFKLSSSPACENLGLFEFLLIAKDCLDYHWNEKVKIVLIRDAIQGQRGCLYSLKMDLVDLKLLLKVSELLKKKSSQSEFLVKLGKLVYALRSMVFSIGRDNEGNTLVSVGSSKDLKSRVPAVLQGIAIEAYISEIFSGTVTKVNHLTKVNWNWNILLKDNMKSNLEKYSVDITNLIDQEELSSNYFDHEKTLKIVLTAECSLILSHLNFISTGLSLETLLIDKLYFKFIGNGVEVFYSSQDKEIFQNAIKKAELQLYQASLINEAYYFALLKLVKGLQKLLDSMLSLDQSNSRSLVGSSLSTGIKSSISVATSFVIPLESDEFNLMMPCIREFLPLVGEFDSKYQNEKGFRKRFFYTKNISELLVSLKACLHEQSIFSSLLKIITSEEIFLLEDDGHGHISFQIRLIHELSLTQHLNKTIHDENYEFYGSQIISFLESLNTITVLGSNLKEYARQLIKFRIEISGKHWLKASVILEKLHSYPDFIHLYSAKDIQAFQLFLVIMHSQRLLEFNIFHDTSFPDIEFWLLAENSYEVLQGLGTNLERLMRSFVDGSVSSLPKYKIFHELTEVAYLLLELVESIKNGLIISYNDFIEFSHSKCILNITHQLGDEVVLQFRRGYGDNSQLSIEQSASHDSADYQSNNNGGPSVLATLTNLEHAIERAHCIPRYFKTYLNREIAKLLMEISAIQLEQVVKHAFEHVQFVGLAGELIIADCSEPLLDLVQTLEKNPKLLSNCLSLRQAWFSAKAILGLISAHYDGDLMRLMDWMDIIRFLCSSNFGTLKLVKNTDLPVSRKTATGALDISAISMVDEQEYEVIYSKPLNAFLGKISFPEPKTQAGKGEVVQPFYTKLSRDQSAMEKVLSDYLNISLSEALQLRVEIRPYLSLLHQHVVFEQIYGHFLKALDDRPATGNAGELDCLHVNDAPLEEIITIFKENDLELRGQCLLFYDAVEALHTIRKGQKLANESMITEGITLARDALSREQSYEVQSDVVYFGKKEKKFLLLAIQEIDVAEEDLKQRYLIRILKEGLFSPGIPSMDYPFSHRAIEVESLVDACNISTNKILPTCRQAQDLLASAKIIVRVRKLILQRNWKAVLELVTSLYNAETQSFEANLKNKDELFSAWKTAGVSEAIDLAYHCYSTGKLQGSADELTDKETIEPSFAEQAIEAFKNLNPEWINDKIKAHELTCSILFQIRSMYAQEKFTELQEYAAETNEKVNSGEYSIIQKCQEEIVLARDHAAYIIITEGFKGALSSGTIIGSFGHLDISDLSIQDLKQAIQLSLRIVSNDPEVLRFQKSAKIVMQLRLAQMKNLWIKYQLDEQLTALLEEILPDTSQPLNEEEKEEGGDETNAFDDEEKEQDTFEERKSSIHEGSEAKEDETEAEKELRIWRQQEIRERKMEAIERKRKAGKARALQRQVEKTYVILIQYDPKDTVEDILMRYDDQIGGTQIDPLAFPELELAYNEMVYRQIISRIISSIYTPGFSGIPGDIQDSEVITNALENCIEFADLYPTISKSSVCNGYVRDAKLLLDSRKCRLANDYIQLQEIIQISEEHNSLVFHYRTGSATHNPDEIPEGNEASDNHEEMKPILSRVWEELMLLKYDSLFQISLHEFALEMKREENLSLSKRKDAHNTSRDAFSSFAYQPLQDNNDEGDSSDEEFEEIDHNIRIYRIETIMEFTRNALLGYPSPELERLLEAIRIAVKLRKFIRDEPGASPQHIIDEIAAIKSRDRKKGFTCYISLLIYEISKMSNVLDFPVLLETIHFEIEKGKNYLEKPIGCIDKNDINIEILQAAYDEAFGSLEIMGTDENRSFLKLAFAILEMRKCIQNGDFSSAMSTVMHHEHYLQASYVQDEIKRLRVEMENQDAEKLISYGLKTGRCLDVVAISKMRSAFEMQNSFDPEVQYQVETILRNKLDSELSSLGPSNRGSRMNTQRLLTGLPTGGSITPHQQQRKNNRRASRRVSQGIADMMTLFQQNYLQQQDNNSSNNNNDSISHTSNNIFFPNIDNDSVDLENETNRGIWQPAPQFIESVQNSIYSLKRAVNVASRVSIKAYNTEYFLHAAKIVLQLRESIVSGNWTDVEELVEQELDLPEVALEEVNAVREGLLYQRCLVTVCESIKTGLITGEVYNINFGKVEFLHLLDVLEAFEIGGFQDRSTVLLIEFVKHVVNMRKHFLSWCCSEGIVTEDLIDSSLDIQKAAAKPVTTDIVVNDPAAAALSMSITGGNSENKNKDLQLFHILEEFEYFEEKKLTELQQELGILQSPSSPVPISRDGTRSRGTSNALALPTPITSMKTLSGIPYQLTSSDFNWINEIVDTIQAIQGEINLIREVIEYRNLIHHMLEVLKVFPVPLLHYLQYQENLKTNNLVSNKLLLTTFSSNHYLRRNRFEGIEQMIRQDPTLSSRYADQYASHYYLVMKNQREANLRILSAEYSIGSTDFNLYLEILSRNDFYFIHLLEKAIVELQNYIEKVRHSTSEELIIILSVAKTILSMRQALQTPSELQDSESARLESVHNNNQLTVFDYSAPYPSFIMFQSFWITETTHLLSTNVIPRNFGIKEINIYVEISQQIISFYKELIVLLKDLTPAVSLDRLDMNVDLQTNEIQLLLVKIEQFLSLHFSVILKEFVHFLDSIYFLIKLIHYFQEENFAELKKAFDYYPLPSDNEMVAVLLSKNNRKAAARPLEELEGEEIITETESNYQNRKHQLPTHLVFSKDCPELQDLFEYLYLSYHFSSFHRKLQERITLINSLFANNDLFQYPLKFPLLAHQTLLINQDYQLLKTLFDSFHKIQRFPLSFPITNERKPSKEVVESEEATSAATEGNEVVLPLETGDDDHNITIKLPSEVQEDIASSVETHRNIFQEESSINNDSVNDQINDSNMRKTVSFAPQDSDPNISWRYSQTKTFKIGKTLFKIFHNLLETHLWSPISEDDEQERRRRVEATTSFDEDAMTRVQETAKAKERIHQHRIIYPNQCDHPLFNHYFHLPIPMPDAFSITGLEDIDNSSSIATFSASGNREVNLFRISEDILYFERKEKKYCNYLFENESIFHIFYRCSFYDESTTHFSESTISFFNSLLYHLVNEHATTDLLYYYQKGIPKIDNYMGNLMLSELYLNFTKNILKKIAGVLDFCSRNFIGFSLSKDSLEWYTWIKMMADIRSYLIQERSIWKLRDFLSNHFLLMDFYQHHHLYYHKDHKLARATNDNTKNDTADLEEIDEDDNKNSFSSLLKAKLTVVSVVTENQKKAHPLLNIYTLLPFHSQFHLITQELEAYSLYLLAISDEIEIMNSIQSLYSIYTQNTGAISAANERQNEYSSVGHSLSSKESDTVFFFTKKILEEYPFNQLMPMMQSFQHLHSATKFHEFIVYLGFLVYNLIYNLFLGSTNIVNSILEELQMILYEGEKDQNKTVANKKINSNASSASSTPRSGNKPQPKASVIHNIPVRIHCPLTDYFKETFSAIRRLFQHMSGLIWPKFQEDHIVFQKYIPKNIKQLQNNSNNGSNQFIVNVFPSISPSGDLQQSPLHTISTFFASPDDNYSPFKALSRFSPPRASSSSSSVPFELSSPYHPSSTVNPLNRKSEKQTLFQQQLRQQQKRYSSLLRVTASAGNNANLVLLQQKMQMIPLYEFLIKENYEVTLLLIHRICEIKDFIETEHSSSKQINSYIPSFHSLQYANKQSIPMISSSSGNEKTLLAIDRNLKLLIPKHSMDSSLPFELYYRLLTLYLNQLSSSSFLIMNPHYSMLLLLILYYLRKEIIKGKQLEMERKGGAAAVAVEGRADSRLLKRIEKFNHRFSFYKTTLDRLDSLQQQNSFFDTGDDYSNSSGGFDLENEEEEDQELFEELLQRANPANPLSVTAKNTLSNKMLSRSSSSGGGGNEHYLTSRTDQAFSFSTPSTISGSPLVTDKKGPPLYNNMIKASRSDSRDSGGSSFVEEILRSNSSDEMRRECFMVGLSHELVLLIQELPSFVEEYYHSDLYHLYDHHHHHRRNTRLGDSSSRQTSFDFNPEEVLHYTNQEGNSLLYGDEENEGLEDRRNPLAISTEKAQEFKRIIYNFYHETIQHSRQHQPISSHQKNKATTNRKKNSKDRREINHPHFKKFREAKQRSSPGHRGEADDDEEELNSMSNKPQDTSLDLNGFYPLHHDLIPNLISIFKHLYIIQHELDSGIAEKKISLPIQQYHLQYHQRRNSTYYSVEEKQRRKSSIIMKQEELQQERNNRMSFIRPRQVTQSQNLPHSILKKAPSNAMQTIASPPGTPSKKKLSIIITPERGGATSVPLQAQQEEETTKADATNNNNNNNNNNIPFPEILKITEDLQINNELWFLFQLQKMIDLLQREQETVLREETDHPNYQRNHYFYYNGLFQRTLSFFMICSKIFPSLQEVFQGNYLPENERKEREKELRRRKQERERSGNDMDDHEETEEGYYLSDDDESEEEEYEGGNEGIASKSPFGRKTMKYSSPQKKKTMKGSPQKKKQTTGTTNEKADSSHLNKKGIFATLSSEFI